MARRPAEAALTPALFSNLVPVRVDGPKRFSIVLRAATMTEAIRTAALR